MIQESKFLGGDMEHTHLVKGLDFALLQKVSQIMQRVHVKEVLALICAAALPKNIPSKFLFCFCFFFCNFSYLGL